MFTNCSALSGTACSLQISYSERLLRTEWNLAGTAARGDSEHIVACTCDEKDML